MKRTDLAIEAKKLSETEGNKIPGLIVSEEEQNGFNITTVEVLNYEGEKAIGKSRGKYITVEVEPLLKRNIGAFNSAVLCLSDYIRKMLKADKKSPVLVVGLGNRNITADSIGSYTVQNTLATRHLIKTLPKMFGELRPTAVLECGVLALTGVESAEVIRALVNEIKPRTVICIDALAAASSDTLCRTVQLTDTGISPGSGVGNSRPKISKDTLGVPVIAIGVPTVIDADIDANGESLIYTPRDIDEKARGLGKLIGYAVDLALNPTLSIDDITMMSE